MKILVPQDISVQDIESFKDISPEVSVVNLYIKITTSGFKRFFRRLFRSRLKPYFVYRITRKCIMRDRYEFYINDARMTEPQYDIDVFLASFIVKPDMFADLVRLLPNLKWIHSTRTGVEHLINDTLKTNNITMTSSKNVHTDRVAEFVIGSICSVIKKIPRHINNTRKRSWVQQKSIEFRDCTIGILGTGDIGKMTAKLAKDLNMNVIGVNRAGHPLPNFDRTVIWTQLPEVLKESDVLVNCLPETRETIGKLGKKEFQQMKKSAYLINIGRAGVIRERALVRALRKKEIAGAVLDVYQEEPLPNNHPFFRTRNLIISFHSAWSSRYSRQAIMDKFRFNITQYLDQSQLEGRVDVYKGY